jgi:hypothetical protein
MKLWSGEGSTMRNYRFYHSSNIFRAIKSRRLGREKHLARIEEGRCVFKIITGKPTGNRPLGRPISRWKAMLQWILKKWVVLFGCG